MDVASVTTDNLTIVLERILDFTQQRHQVLARNLADFRSEGFVPCDLPLGEFTACMTRAVSEHLSAERLLFADTDHIRFETGGHFDADPVVDEQGLRLLREDANSYLSFQIRKLSENQYNTRIARQLLERKQRSSSARSEKSVN